MPGFSRAVWIGQGRYSRMDLQHPNPDEIQKNRDCLTVPADQIIHINIISDTTLVIRPPNRGRYHTRGRRNRVFQKKLREF